MRGEAYADGAGPANQSRFRSSMTPERRIPIRHDSAAAATTERAEPEFGAPPASWPRDTVHDRGILLTSSAAI